MRADDSAPPRERSRCFTHLGPDESVANASSGSPPSQVLPTSLLPAPPSSPTRRQGRGTSRDTSLLCPSRSPDGDGPGPLYCSGSDLDLHQVKALTLIQVFQQISLVCLKHRHRVQRSNSLTCCCVFLKGLRWQGGPGERMSRPRRDSWLASLPQGASLIAVSTHPLNVSITGMLKPTDARGKRVLNFFFFFFTPRRHLGPLPRQVKPRRGAFHNLQQLVIRRAGGLSGLSLSFFALRHLLLFLGITQQSTSSWIK